MRILMVQFTLKDGTADAFLEAAIGDGRGSVGNEAGCYRFDIIQDRDDPNRVAFTEVYDDDHAIDEVHVKAAHMTAWRDATKDMIEEVKVSRCRNVFPGDLASWNARKDGINEGFSSGNLFIIHAELPVQADRVDDFIEAVVLDGVGSTNLEPGCLRFDIYQDIEDPTKLWLYEVYVNPEAFQFHTTTPHIIKWRDTVADWYEGERGPAIRGKNVWPTDQWNWSSGSPLA
ncbi:MAG: putative quinol monooxygenase [Dehalococcoidia bacterium]